MGLLSTAGLTKILDALAFSYDLLRDGAGTVPYTRRKSATFLAGVALAASVADSDSYDVQNDLNDPLFGLQDTVSARALAETTFKTVIDALSAHANAQGASVDASITDLSTWFNYLNSGTWGDFQVHPAIADLLEDMGSLDADPDVDGTDYDRRVFMARPDVVMRTRAKVASVTGADTLVDAVPANYGLYRFVVECVGAFVGSANVPVVRVGYLDEDGAAQTVDLAFPATVGAASYGGTFPAVATGEATTVSPMTTGAQAYAISRFQKLTIAGKAAFYPTATTATTVSGTAVDNLQNEAVTWKAAMTPSGSIRATEVTSLAVVNDADYTDYSIRVVTGIERNYSPGT